MASSDEQDQHDEITENDSSGDNLERTNPTSMGNRAVNSKRERSTSSKRETKKTSESKKSKKHPIERVGLLDEDISYEPGEADFLSVFLVDGPKKQLIDRLLGCAYGQALGDAYGLSTEFQDRKQVERHYPNPATIIPFPADFTTSHASRWKPCDWTDDTDQWILILETLIVRGGNVKTFAKKLSNWIKCGFPELGDYGGMGLGANVSQVVRTTGYTKDPLRASEQVWERSGRQAAPNGGVMRCSATAFVHFNDMEALKTKTIQLCKTTHFDPRCIASCLAVCLSVGYLLRGDVDATDIEAFIQRIQKETLELLGDDLSEEHRNQFIWYTEPRTLEELNLDDPQRIGYTYKCLASGFYGLRSDKSFEETLNALIRYGGDADTNGAVCGTMFGARHGYRNLPYEWLRKMPNKKWLDRKIIIALKQMGVIEDESNVVKNGEVAASGATSDTAASGDTDEN